MLPRTRDYIIDRESCDLIWSFHGLSVEAATMCRGWRCIKSQQGPVGYNIRCRENALRSCDGNGEQLVDQSSTGEHDIFRIGFWSRLERVSLSRPPSRKSPRPGLKGPQRHEQNVFLPSTRCGHPVLVMPKQARSEATGKRCYLTKLTSKHMAP